MDRLLESPEYKDLCPNTKSKVYWWQLNPNRPVVLERRVHNNIFKEALSRYGCYSGISRKTGLNRKTISSYCRLSLRFKVGDLIRILRSIDMNPNDVNAHIKMISDVESPVLPFDMNTPDSSEIIAAFLSDGHLPKDSYAKPMYCAGEEELHLRLVILCKKIFGRFSVQTKMGHKSLITRFPSVIGDALELAGVPRGDKRRKNQFLPKHIFCGSDAVVAAYLRRAFDDEGDVHVSSSKKAIRLTRSVDCGDIYKNMGIEKQKWKYGVVDDAPMNNLILGECLLLRRMGIDARLYKEGIYRSINGRTTAKWRLQISQQDGLKTFSENIGFTHTTKKCKLKQAIKSYKRKKSPNGIMNKTIWEYVLYLSEKNGTFTFGDIGRRLQLLGMNSNYAGAFLSIFLKDKRIRKIKRGIYVINKNN
jgi:hypothetical protein